MPNPQRPALTLTAEERRVLETVARSRMLPAAKQQRARMLLAYADGAAIADIARRLRTYYYKVKR
ncbi:MAG TPA: IS630 family transposase, partial [Chloroflexota bacterium]|nr:IS630 family transposase [Chloroflexota bacterium]